jgi:beta-glucosidase-like glycosyl hydrolase
LCLFVRRFALEKKETPGEDPKLNADYAADFVSAFQYDPQHPSQLKASACCKHFAAYSLEFWKTYIRYGFDARVTERDMKETYLPAFESCVRRGNVTSLMCSYNAINGVPSCVNQALLEETARKEWGFQGYITGDCDAVKNSYIWYHYKQHTPNEIVADTLNATVDIACDQFLQNHAVDAVKSGAVKEGLVDRALGNLFKIQMRLGMFDAQSPFRNLGSDDVNSPEHQQLALEAARQGIVLLKNKGNTLPLSPATIGSLALIGPYANSKTVFLGNYFGLPPFIVSIAQGLGLYLSTVKTFHGCSLWNSLQQEPWLAQAERAAAKAEQTVLVVGSAQMFEAESKDRYSLLLPGRQAELVRRCARAAQQAG